MSEPLEHDADQVPSIGRRELILVDGRTFAISDESGQMGATTHGLVHDDLRHLSRFTIVIDDGDLEVLASSAPTPLSAVIVGRLLRTDDKTVRAVFTRRRWVASGLREDMHVHNPSPTTQRWTVRVALAADFAHVFHVKAGRGGTEHHSFVADADGWLIRSADDDTTGSAIRAQPAPGEVDIAAGMLTWHLVLPPRQEAVVSLTVEPVVDGESAGLPFPCGMIPADAIPMRRLDSWRRSVPRIVSTDPRLARVTDQALADIAALRIIDSAHVDRPVIAAGAPWFMTLFGRDSLITAWMMLPFEPGLAGGVLSTLAELQGHRHDPVSEEQPGKILHELRRHGGGGPFANRSRYYGTVDATPLFVMLAAEAHRWGALSSAQLEQLAPAVNAALDWIIEFGDSNHDGFVDYEGRNALGLSNQGWKDSWDGVTFADGRMPDGPIALAEVQGYVYAALLGAAELSKVMQLAHDADTLQAKARALADRFNEVFWDERGWFAMGLDGSGARIDALTTNPGHALWTGIADERLAHQYLDRLCEPEMWTGWGLRTLANSMSAYDPLSYHNGSVWPHDTAICAAGAARYGRWEIVDRIVDGALDAASEFGGRPPELFAGISRDFAPMPVAYPSSCSPQAWSSASILLLLRTMIGLDAAGGTVVVERPELSSLPDMRIERLHVAASTVTVDIADGRCAAIETHTS
jgi:glycogen debranching enzyme